MQVLRPDGGMAEDVGPPVETFPIFFEDVALDTFVKGGAGVGGGDRELDGEGVQLLGVADRVPDPLLGVGGEPEGVIGDDADPQSVAAFDDTLLLLARDGFAVVGPQGVRVGGLHAHFDAAQSRAIEELDELGVQFVGARLHSPADVEVVPEEQIGEPLRPATAEGHVGVAEGNAADAVFPVQVVDFVDDAFGVADAVFRVDPVRAVVAGIGASPASEHGEGDTPARDDLVPEALDVELVPARKRQAVQIPDEASVHDARGDLPARQGRRQVLDLSPDDEIGAVGVKIGYGRGEGSEIADAGAETAPGHLAEFMFEITVDDRGGDEVEVGRDELVRAPDVEDADRSSPGGQHRVKVGQCDVGDCGDPALGDLQQPGEGGVPHGEYGSEPPGDVFEGAIAVPAGAENDDVHGYSCL